MIPILFDGTEQDFLNNGLGRLADAISCKVTEERNGQFELELTYPITGVHYDDIAENAIIYAKTEEGGNNQAFIIYKVSRPLNGIVTVNAEHISYVLNGFTVTPFTAISCADAVSKISENIQPSDSPFTFQTDVQTLGAFHLDAPRNVRGLLGGEQGSLLDVYGGKDYKFDNFNVYLLENRGVDNGVSIRYGKNLTDLKNIIDTTSVYTGILPYWQDDEGNRVMLPEKVVLSEHAADYPYKIIKPVDFRSDFETAPTEAQLRARAESYLTSNAPWKLKNSIDVSFVNLAQTEDYKEFEALERVKLCDYVTVVYRALGVNVKTKVIKTVYNVLTERYDSISLGDTTYTLAKAIQSAIDSPTQEQVSNSIANAVGRATKLIQGGLGGHVVFNTNGDGEPQEILIMDTDDISTAVNVIRMNLNGIGFSHNGYEGPFDTAWTIDGHFVADYIDTGELNGNLIKANTVSTDVLTVGAQDDLRMYTSLVPYDAMTNVPNRWFLSDSVDYFRIMQGSITSGGITYPALTISNERDLTGPSIRLGTRLVGKPTLEYKFKLQFIQDKTLDDNVTLSAMFCSDTGVPWNETIFTFPRQTYLANHEYEFSGTYTLRHTADPYKREPNLSDEIISPHAFVFWRFGTFGAGFRAYIYDFEIKQRSADYVGAQLQFTSDGLNSVVQEGSVISTINQSPEQVSIRANKIDLTGALSLHGDFTSYDENDDTTYAFMDSGSISFFNQGANVFTVASLPLLGNNAGIFFGDAEDAQSLIRYTYINQEFLQTPTLLVRKDGSQTTPTSAGQALIEGDFSVYGSSKFYGNVYDSGGSVVFVSDKRKKKNIKDLVIEKAKSFLMALNPRVFKFKDGTSDRYHHGFIAQEVKKAMNGDDWGVYVEDKSDDFIGLRYDELIADLVKVVQDQEKRIDALERKLDDYTGI